MTCIVVLLNVLLLRYYVSSLFKKPGGKRQTITTLTYAAPLQNCKCSGCLESLGSDDDISHYSDICLSEPYKFAVK